MKNTIILLMLVVWMMPALGQSVECTPFENTEDKFKNWTYSGKKLREMPRKELTSILLSLDDNTVNSLVRKYKRLNVTSQVFSYTGLIVAVTGAAIVMADITTGLAIAIPGLALQITGLIISGSANTALQRSIIGYNTVCDVKLGMASQSLGPGIYITLK